MNSIDISTPVMVTGATGYVAGVLVKKLLDEGFTVHAPVRDPDDAEKLQYLNEIASAANGTIKYFKADLLETGSYAEALMGCELVFHTASPFTVGVADPQLELIGPALSGTRNVLTEACRPGTVKRIVLTSSCAAMCGDNTDLAWAPNGALTEASWNTSSSIDHNAYSYSKTLAEKEAWRISEKQSQWDLVVINPSLVVGPGINPYATSESYTIVKQMGDGTLKAGAPDWGMGVVDVRDVADAHYSAGFSPDAKGRYIVSGHNSSIFAMSQTLLDRFGKDFPIPRKKIPKWLLWLVGPMIDKKMTRKMIARNVDMPWRADNSKSIRDLQVSYRPLEASMNDFFQQLVDSGQV